MGTVFHDRREAVVTATSEQAGYVAANLNTEGTRRAWRSTTAGANNVTFTFDAAGPYAALMLRDVNFASCPVFKSADGVSFSAAGTFVSYPDPKIPGRRGGLLLIPDPSVKAIRLEIAAGTPLDGLAYWRGGAAYNFAASQPLPIPPEYGARTRAKFPRVSTELANGRTAQATTGTPFNVIELTFERRYNEVFEPLIRLAQQGTAGLQLDIDNYPEMAWPVKHQEVEVGEVFAFYDYSQMPLTFTEVV